MGYNKKKILNDLKIEQKKKIEKYEYDLVNFYCKTKKKQYNERKHRIIDLPCNCWSCARCRNNLKTRLFYNTIVASSIFDLNKHIVLTVPGKEYRSLITPVQSYKLLNYDFLKLRKVIKYKYNDFEYISFLRSQTDFYAHIHVLSNSFIPKDFLKKKSKKYKNIGFTNIKQNKNVAEYLTNDFWKDHEYVIPKGYRHFNSSKNVSIYLNLNGFESNKQCINFEIQNKIPILNQIEKIIYKQNYYPAPLETILKYLYK